MGLLYVYYADTAFYLPPGDILSWIFIDQVADEIDPFTLSPMSYSSRTHTYPTWRWQIRRYITGYTFFFRSLSGLERSKKAAVVGSPTPFLVLTAATAAYELGRSTVLCQMFTREGEEEL
jgi:hypothetical protein